VIGSSVSKSGLFVALRLGQVFAFVAAGAVVSACSGGTVTLPRQRTSTPAPATTPSVKPSTKPTATATPAATPTATSTGALNTAAVNTTFKATESYYLTLNHTSVTADIQAVAQQMVASGAYKSAVVTAGGISATLPDGSLALVFADVPEDLMPSSSSAAVARAASANVHGAERRPMASSLSSPNPHEHLFLYNDTDPNFHEVYDQEWAAALKNVPFTGPAPLGANAKYGVSTGSVSLVNITHIGATNAHPIDFLNITTHGMVGERTLSGSSTYQYYLLSTTPLSDDAKTTYAADFAAHNLAYALFLSTRTTPEATTNLGLLSFTPDFLTAHLQFNPGAIVNFAACYGASPIIQDDVSATLKAAGVGRWFGWTKAVGIIDDYQSISFLFDRLVGEQSPSASGLDADAAQRTPPQRPFSLMDVYGAMQSEVRSSAIQASNGTTYDISDINFAPNATQPPLNEGTQARYSITDFGAEGTSTAPIFYAFPSISNLSIAESPTAGTMTINGLFPTATGTVQIADASGTTPLTVTSWSRSVVTATLPPGGNGSSGLVTVLSADGVPSNPVPLTQWSGVLTFNENDSIPDLDGTSGSGSGSISAQLNVNFRADVHPVVPSIDVSPSPQPLVFDYTMGNSTAQLTSYSGSYTSSEDTPHTATWSLQSPAPILQPKTPPLGDNTFEVRAWASQPLPCNAGTSSDITTGDLDVFCPLVGLVADPSQILCTDDDAGALCTDNGFAGLIVYSGPYDAMGLLSLTMDPATYKIAVAGTTSQFTSAQFYDEDRPATASMSGTISAPAFPPSAATPAYRTRAIPLRIRRTSLGPISPDEAAYAARRCATIKGAARMAKCRSAALR
jgi:hypothetical protein